MKKTYITPTSVEYRLDTKNAILTTSSLSVGDPINSGSGDAREDDGDEW